MSNIDLDLVCENCHERPIANLIRLEIEPVGLCSECIAAVAMVIEDENGY